MSHGECTSYQMCYLLNYLPEHLIEDICDFHMFYAYHKEDYLENNLSIDKVDYGMNNNY